MLFCREETDDISKSNMSNYELSNTHKYSSFAIRMKKKQQKKPHNYLKMFRTPNNAITYRQFPVDIIT